MAPQAGHISQSMEPRRRTCCSECPSRRLSRLPTTPTHAFSFPASSGIAYRRSASAPCASVTTGYANPGRHSGGGVWHVHEALPGGTALEISSP